MIDEAACSKLKAIPMLNNIVVKCIYDMSKDLEEQLNDKMQDNRSDD